MNRRKVFETKGRQRPESYQPPAVNLRDLIERMAAGEKVDCDTIRESALTWPDAFKPGGSLEFELKKRLVDISYYQRQAILSCLKSLAAAPNDLGFDSRRAEEQALLACWKEEAQTGRSLAQEPELSIEQGKVGLSVVLNYRPQLEQLAPQELNRATRYEIDVYGEFLHHNTLCCLIELDHAWLASPVVQRQIEFWQMRAKISGGRGEFSKKLRGVGTALDPVKGRGNFQRHGEDILSIYEISYEIWHEAICLIKKVFPSRKDLRDPDIVSRIADSDDFKEKLGGLCETLEERVQLIKDVVNHRPSASRKAMAFVKGETGLSEWAIKDIVGRERRNLSRENKGKTRGGTGKILPSH